MKADSATASYVQRLSAAFYGGVRETASEFEKAFSGGGGGGGASDVRPALLSWVDQEMERFCARVQRQVFSPSTPLEIIASSVAAVREGGLELREDGLDVTFLIDDRFRGNVERTVSNSNLKCTFFYYCLVYVKVAVVIRMLAI